MKKQNRRAAVDNSSIRYDKSDPVRPVVVWRLADGRVGHENQARGLVRSLGQRISVTECVVPAPSIAASGFHAAGFPWPAVRNLPRPDLIIGAGHHTHLPLLTAVRRYGGRSILIMRSTFPHALFDLCLVPDMFNLKPTRNVVITYGAMNLVHAPTGKPRDRVVVLIGGPSKHHRWTDQRIVNQIRSIADASAPSQVDLTTSRRTPSSLAPLLAELSRDCANLNFAPWDKTEDGWVTDRLSKAVSAWVTEDSVSMIYESLTAGASVGILTVPQRRQSGRVVQLVRRLVNDGWVTSYEDWSAGRNLTEPPQVLNEAQRCALEILDRFPELNLATENPVSRQITSHQLVPDLHHSAGTT